ncbi:MAG: hypothetical protein ACYS0I_03175 [Planctomycetota bacterium]|jgi:hypothetical protein
MPPSAKRQRWFLAEHFTDFLWIALEENMPQITTFRGLRCLRDKFAARIYATRVDELMQGGSIRKCKIFSV